VVKAVSDRHMSERCRGDSGRSTFLLQMPTVGAVPVRASLSALTPSPFSSARSNHRSGQGPTARKEPQTDTVESLTTVTAYDALTFAKRNLAENEGLTTHPGDEGSDEKRIAQGSFADAAQVLDETRGPQFREMAAKLLRLSGAALLLQD
jgi:hypothetical protein